MTIRKIPRLRHAPGALLVLWAAVTPAPGQDAPHPTTHSAVRDSAGMFSAEAVKKAEARLQKIEQEAHVPVVIESEESVDEPLDAAAQRRLRALPFDGLLILLAEKEHKLEVRVSPRFTGILGRAGVQVINRAFVEEFKKQNFDGGLDRAVEEIETLLARVKKEGKVIPAASREGLVLRDQVRLTLAGARAIIAGAEAKAEELRLKVNIAVVDDGGHLIAFERMDGARPASGYTATTKAVTAATFRAPSGPLPPGTTVPDPLLNLSLQNAAAVSGGKITTLFGGVPVVVDGQVIAGVGVGGGTGEQDAQVARAGIEHFMAELEGRQKQ